MAEHQQRELGYRPALDGLRALAVVLVVGEHAWPGVFVGGWVGVDLFFVLSGFLITTLLIEEHQRHGFVWLSGFFQRRVLRLTPGLVAGLAGFGVAWSIAAPDYMGRFFELLPSVYATNVMMALKGGDLGSLSHLWSLAAEEQFYLLWPPVLAAMLHRGASRRLILTVTAGGAVASTGACVAVWAGGATWQRLYFGPDTHAAPLLVGCLLGQLWVWGLLPAVERVAWPAVGVLAGVVVFADQTHAGALYAGGLTVIAVACAVVVAAVLQSAAVAGVLSAAPLVSVGRCSYALYLWHPLLLWLAHHYSGHWMAVVAAVVASYPVAVISTRLIEAPFLRLKSRIVRPQRSGDREPVLVGEVGVNVGSVVG